MTDDAVVEVTDQPYELTEVGLVVRPHIQFERWENLGQYLGTLYRGMQFYLGDWLNAGERLFPDRYSQALDATKMAYQTLTNMAWVARKVDIRQRRSALTWSHHAEVAALPPDRQKHFLDIAEEEGLTVTELRYRVSGGKVTATVGQPAGVPTGPDSMEEAKKKFLALKNDQRDEFLRWANDLMAG